mgnify:FL=1
MEQDVEDVFRRFRARERHWGLGPVKVSALKSKSCAIAMDGDVQTLMDRRPQPHPFGCTHTREAPASGRGSYEIFVARGCGKP